jgi:TRAP-type uncharacterized transport system substrate-binding protein
VLARGAAILAATLALGHTPYRQWQVYRQTRIVLVASAEDGQAFPLAEAIVALLAARLPDDRPAAARARDSVEVARLLVSRQLDIALLAAGEAGAAAAGHGRFSEVGPIPLRLVAVVGPYLVVCREEVPADRAYRLARALAERDAALALPAVAGDAASTRAAPAGRDGMLPLHAGALAYVEGRPEPAPQSSPDPPRRP